jgi:hypothetical protein
VHLDAQPLVIQIEERPVTKGFEQRLSIGELPSEPILPGHVQDQVAEIRLVTGFLPGGKVVIARVVDAEAQVRVQFFGAKVIVALEPAAGSMDPWVSDVRVERR